MYGWTGMSAKDLLEKLVQERTLGPSPTFTVFDVLKALETVAESGSIGRGLLSEKLELGEGATRTIVSRLTKAQLITTSRSGCTLTEKGKRLWEKIKSLVPLKLKIEENELTFAVFNVAILITNQAKKVSKGLEQRDAAVRAGASGATILIYRNHKLILPTISTDISRDYPKAHHRIVQLMNPTENDVVILCCGETLKAAEYGGLAAAWTLL
jgi:predicted transcriptional regulator